MNFIIRNAHLATMNGSDGYGEIPDGALVVRDGLISWIGEDRHLPIDYASLPEIQADRKWLLPGLIDCHSHLVYAGDRSAEYEARLSGATYTEIARSGGGILSTVKSTRLATQGVLVAGARTRLAELTAEGVTTQEIKSGYGLDLETELKMLRAIREISLETPVRIVPTYLCAHAIPPEFSGRADEYTNWICEVGLPKVWEEKLSEQADAFCEGIAFSPEQCRRILIKAKEIGFSVKLHADQLSDSGGGGLVAELGGLSADHLEYLSEESMQAMVRSGTVAVLLPGAFMAVGELPIPPIKRMRELRIPMAVATDCNPGTSPFPSLRFGMNLACWEFRMTPLEVISGVTKHAARALGLQGVCGQLKVGMKADLALFAVNHPREIATTFSKSDFVCSWVNGFPVQK